MFEDLGNIIGDKIEQSEKIKVCMHPNCKTIINSYRAIENDVCSVHVVWYAEYLDKTKKNYQQEYYHKNRDKLLVKYKEYRDKRKGE